MKIFYLVVSMFRTLPPSVGVFDTWSQACAWRYSTNRPGYVLKAAFDKEGRILWTKQLACRFSVEEEL